MNVAVLIFSALTLFAVASGPLPAVAQSGSAAMTFRLPSSSIRIFSGEWSAAEGTKTSSSVDLFSTTPTAKPRAVATARALGGIQIEPAAASPHRPFRSLSLTAKVGTGGIGFDVGMPVAPHLGVRAGAQFFGYNVGIVTDGLHSNAAIQLRNAALMVDVFPFHNGFHLSPGVTLNNDNHIAAAINVPGGQAFTLGGNNFTSAMADPVSGTGGIRFGNNVAPRFTLGWEDALHHRFGHVSLPVEFGFQYSAAPVVSLALAGTACTQGVCDPVTTAGVTADMQQEILKLQNDLHPLRFYPITSTGIRYTFGR